MNFAITRVSACAEEYHRKAFIIKITIAWHDFLKINSSCLYTCECRLYLGDGELGDGSGQVARESGLFAMAGGQIMRRRCCRATSIVFPPIILSKLIYDRLFGRWTVGEAWCVCACACVRGACLRRS